MEKLILIPNKGMIILVFLYFLITIFIIAILVIFSKIKIEVENLRISSKKDRYFNENFKIIIKLYVLSKIPIIKITLTKEKMKKQKLKLQKSVKNLEEKIIKDKKLIDKKMIYLMKELNISIDKINLNIIIGTENAMFTAMIVPIISSIISIFIAKRIKEKKDKYFIVKPIFKDQNFLEILISCIFEIKVIHIINIIYVLVDNRKGEDKYERTSNRRSYDNCYE